MDINKRDDIAYSYKGGRGLDEKLIRKMSAMKGEPGWMLEKRLAAYKVYLAKPVPTWGGDLSPLHFEDIFYYLKPAVTEKKSWDDVPASIKETFEKLGVPQAEREMLAGVKGQYDSEVVYGSLKKTLSEKGVLFLSMDEALRTYPEIVKKYFGTIVPMGDNKLAALNSAVWSGGSFVYVPAGVDVGLPLQAYFRINSESAGQFERTLIIAEEGAKVHYLEGCSAPQFSSASLHAAVVEVVVKKGAKVAYTTVQNWYRNIYNLVTKRAWVEEQGEMRWVDGNLGCLTGDSLVSTPTGYKRIDEIKKSDEIYTFDVNSLGFEKSEVTGWKEIGIKTVYKLSTDDYREILATDNHPFLKLKKRKGFSIYELNWTRLDQLKIGDLIAIQSILPDDGKPMSIDFSVNGRLLNIPKPISETNNDLMWLLGAYLGDGCMEIDATTGRGRRINMAIPIDDKAYTKLIKVLVEMGLKYTHSKNMVTVRISSTYLAELFRYLGMAGLAKTKMVPGWIYGLSLSQKLAFIEGYMDTDGCVRKKKMKNGRQYGQIIFASVNENMLKQMKRLMIMCGLEPKKITTYTKERKLYKGRMKEYKSCYMSMNLDHNLEIIRSKMVEKPSVRFVKIRQIEEIGQEVVYDIEVAGSHSFVANGILVHNSCLTMKYPSCILAGEGAKGEMLSIAWAGKDQHQDTGAKMVHMAPNTSSQIISKSISKGGGRTTYRGMVQINKGAHGARSKVVCDALILDDKSRSDTYPTNKVFEEDTILEHEAVVSRVSEEQLLYLMNRGLPEHEAEAMVVNGFLEPVTSEVPMEYAVEMNRLVELEMEGSVG